MKQKLAAFGWQIVEYLRRTATPFIINLLYGMTMLAASAINEDTVRILLVFLLLGATGFTDFIFMRGAGEIAYKMKVTGERKRANMPVSQDNRIGSYRPAKEYRPYKGFIIGLCICLLPLVLILVGATTGNAGCRAALLFTSGWAYLPVFVCLIAGNPDVTVPAETLWWGLIIVGVILVLCGVAYILGGRVEKRRQDALERRSETIEEQKRARREKRN